MSVNKMFNLYMDDMRPIPGNTNWDGFAAAILHQNDSKDPNWQDWVLVRSIENTKRLLELGIVDNLSLDYDMGPGQDGLDLIKWICETGNFPKGEITMHSANPEKAALMVAYLDNFKAAKNIK